MEHSKQPSQPHKGVVTCPTPIAYASPYQSAATATRSPAVIGAMPPGIQLTSTFPIGPHQVAYQQTAGPLQVAYQQTGAQQVVYQQAGPQQVAYQQTNPHQAGPQQVVYQQAGPQQVAYQQTNAHQVAYQQIQQLHQQQQELQQHQQLQTFWAAQMAEIEQTTDFKNHGLPLSRIKKIMKADEDVKMISAEAPIIFAKACEMFILELTLRSWNHTEENKRRTLQKSDVVAAINQTDVFDFLLDILPKDAAKEEGSTSASAAQQAIAPHTVIAPQVDPMPYYFAQPQQQGTGSEMIMGKPGDQPSASAK